LPKACQAIRITHHFFVRLNRGLLMTIPHGFRALLAMAGGLLLLAALFGCDTSGSPTPDARATDFAQQKAVALTYVVVESTTTADKNAAFARVKPLIKVTLADAGAATPGGSQVQVTVTNGDTAEHTIVVRLFARAAPLDTSAYAVGSVTLAAGATGSTTISAPLPLADLAPQILQIDGTWDFSPPTP
jgi:hypothetical protein